MKQTFYIIQRTLNSIDAKGNIKSPYYFNALTTNWTKVLSVNCYCGKEDDAKHYCTVFDLIDDSTQRINIIQKDIEIQVIESKNKKGEITSYYFPIDGPWPSEVTELILKAAHELFEKLCKTNPVVFLISSSHWASPGYWIELAQNQLAPSDRIIKRFTA